MVRFFDSHSGVLKPTIDVGMYAHNSMISFFILFGFIKTISYDGILTSTEG